MYFIHLWASSIFIYRYTFQHEFVLNHNINNNLIYSSTIILKKKYMSTLIQFLYSFQLLYCEAILSYLLQKQLM